MVKIEDNSQQIKQNPQTKITKRITKLPPKPTLSPFSEAKVNKYKNKGKS